MRARPSTRGSAAMQRLLIKVLYVHHFRLCPLSPTWLVAQRLDALSRFVSAFLRRATDPLLPAGYGNKGDAALALRSV